MQANGKLEVQRWDGTLKSGDVVLASIRSEVLY
jgi:hypothetical protein